MKTVYDCITIGGGISGISFAHQLHKSGKKALLLEKDNRLGGQINTGYFRDFWYEMGAHTCYSTYLSLAAIINDTGCTKNVRLLNKHPYRIHTHKGFRSIASALSVPGMLLHGPKALLSKKDGKTVREYYRYILGHRNYDRLFSKAFRAVISQPADDYPAELLLKRRKYHCKDMPRKYTFTNGLSSLIAAIIEKTGCQVQLSATVTGIRRLDGEQIYELDTQSGEKWYATSIALAVDPQSAAVLLENIEPDLASLLATIPVFRSESLSLVLPKDVPIEKMAGIIPQSNDFLSAVSRDLVDHPQYRCFTFHFEQGTKNDSQKMETVCKTLHISQTDIVEQSAAKHILPSLRTCHLNLTEQVENKRIHAGIYLLGNYFKGVSLEDCVQRAQVEFDRFTTNAS
jgi:protoporphyrinogen oxidase